MIDNRLRGVIDPPLALLARWMRRAGVTANQVTVAGFGVGLLAVPLIALGHPLLALIPLALNRIADGLDGAIARQVGITDLGGYLDIVLDFLFYNAFVFAFALAAPENRLASAFLILSFVGTGTTFLAWSVFAAKRRMTTSARGVKSFYYLGGLTEGFETIVAFVLMLIYSESFVLIALVFAALCWITTATRIAWAVRSLTPDVKEN